MAKSVQWLESPRAFTASSCEGKTWPNQKQLPKVLTRKIMPSSAVRKAFAAFDTDGSGTLTAAECLAILTRGADEEEKEAMGMSEEDAQEIIDDVYAAARRMTPCIVCDCPLFEPLIAMFEPLVATTVR